MSAQRELVDQVNHFLAHTRGDADHPGTLTKLPGLNVVGADAETKTIVFELRVTNAFTNFMGNLHGGATATIIDETTSVVHTALDHVAMHVSTDLSVTYVSAAKVGETVLIECTGKAAGKTLLFSEASLFIKKEDGSRGRLVAYGKHTKFVMQPRL